MSLLDEKECLLINGIILSIYETHNMSKMRKDFLELLYSLISYESAIFDFATKKDNIQFFDPVSVNFDERYLNDYFEYYQQIDYTRHIFLQHNPIIYRDTDLVDKKDREETEIFKEWLSPMGIYFGGGSSIIHNGNLLGSVSLFRSQNSGDFSKRDLFILNLLNGHLCNRLEQVHQISKKSIDLREHNHNVIQKYNLTNRELEIIRLIFSGDNNQDISNRIFVSSNTVKKHIQNIFRKLDVNSRTQLINTLLENNFKPKRIST